MLTQAVTEIYPVDSNLTITAIECIAKDKPKTLGVFSTRNQSIPYIINSIRQGRTTAATPANPRSSRSHLIITISGRTQYGMLVDIGGEEESMIRSTLPDQMSKISMEISHDNCNFRRLLEQIMKRQDFSVPGLKRASGLNAAVCSFMERVAGPEGTPGVDVKVLITCDGGRVDLLKRTLASYY
ncbi:hypothetical protein P167DRAFT_540175 [Morchella conica CCBAS932]|uniref:Kinesin motor domain-containing protein n=1 Tax=Morchella conica CCBAS932 TaxID=1392247 RepID=A0A3N4KG77_9PEZI|nr:hypothetical protein P167DRAFT_540175 [Morchella conica CCBAS932]